MEGVMAITLASGLELPGSLACVANQTAGFHDYPHNEESYEPVVFFESRFMLEVNRVLSQHLAATNDVDVYLTFKKEDAFEKEDELVELTCFQVRGVGDTRGLSCSNQPPAQMLLLNLDNLRFTRTSIGGWTFTGAQVNAAGDSIFVEYGQCTVE